MFLKFNKSSVSDTSTLRKLSLVIAGSVLLAFGNFRVAQAYGSTNFNSVVDNTVSNKRLSICGSRTMGCP